ncbi:hypothetical protein [Aestuariicoccus sp. MJ-SS9]|uniref:hypothetical protein n=1 Tax=Aestuariicoccus sp. MJ-SS9 TaxID=3079855 RepID=UPI0029101CEA|nr:hypothetical protein [Aestuariicoccus sp. MJ-SS9]MDU8909785.1 hypothetical protein [Aestuariicoccus sp. MJ-SS9]
MTDHGDYTSLWTLKGRIDIPLRDARGHALKFQFPTVHRLAPDRWRLYLAARGEENVGRMVFADLDPTRAMRVLDCGEVIDSSGAGQGDYDADGIGPSCVFQTDAGLTMAATGLRLRMPAYDAGIGFLRSDDDGRSWRRCPEIAPFYGPSPHLFAVGADIQRIGGRYHMWFAQGAGWREDVKPYPEPTYQIGHATSDDGTAWVADPAPAIAFASPEETGITRPCVRLAAEGYEMWYCTRRKYDPKRPELRRYRIGYATSSDLVHWRRQDAAHRFAPPPAPGDFDGQMQCYPTVAATPGRTVMFYCGDGYGRGGVGYAERVTAR